MSPIQELLHQPIVNQLGWVLVHFLWQGAATALLLAGVLRLMRNRPADERYAAACSALLLLAIDPVLTFVSLPAPQTDVRQTTATVADRMPSGVVTSTHLLANDAEMAPSIPSQLMDPLLPWLVSIWSGGVILLSLRLFSNWLGVQWTRRSATSLKGTDLQSRMILMARRMGIRRPVRLLQSAAVHGPAVVGFLRPIILVPAMALTSLSLRELEAILAHELAHIRRHDYLVNLLQSVVETLLFYHPAVWWISRQVRQERENCCDDVAVQACGNRLLYATALADLDDLRSIAPELAMAAQGGALLPRIRRVLRVPSQETGTPDWGSGSLAVAMVALAFTVCVARADAGNGPTTSHAAAPAMNQPLFAASPAVVTTTPVPPAPQTSAMVATKTPLMSVPAAAGEPAAPADRISTPLMRTVTSVGGGAAGRESRDTATAPSPEPKRPMVNIDPAEAPAVNSQPSNVRPAPVVLPPRAKAALSAPRVVAQRVRAYAMPGDAQKPATNVIALTVPRAISRVIEQEAGYWPLGETKIYALNSRRQPLILAGSVGNADPRDDHPTGWELHATVVQALPLHHGFFVAGSIELTMYPDRVYTIRFDARIHTEKDPHVPALTQATDADVNWFGPEMTRLNPRDAAATHADVAGEINEKGRLDLNGAAADDVDARQPLNLSPAARQKGILNSGRQRTRE